LGGWITDNYSWHWIFFINVPFGIISLSLVQWLLVEPDVLERERHERLRHGLRIDYIGVILVALFLGCLEIVLDKGQQDDWFSSGFIDFFAIVSLISFLLFVPWELSHDDPVVDVKLMLNSQFATSFSVMLSVGAVLFGSTQILPQLLQTTFDYSALLSGLALMPGGLAMLVMMPISGFLSNVVQPKYLIAFGMAMIALSMWHMTSLPPDASFGFFAWARVFQMFGLPFLFIPINTVAYSGLGPEHTNQASALINVARNLGGSIGISLAATVVAQRAQFHQARLTEHVYASSTALQHTTDQLSHYFAGQGAAAVNASGLAIAWIGQLIGTQSTLMGYIDIFWDSAIFTGLMVPLTLLLLRPVRLGAAPAAH
jgi:DHA2 family multidrug resistance protein